MGLADRLKRRSINHGTMTALRMLRRDDKTPFQIGAFGLIYGSCYAPLLANGSSGSFEAAVHKSWHNDSVAHAPTRRQNTFSDRSIWLDLRILLRTLVGEWV